MTELIGQLTINGLCLNIEDIIKKYNKESLKKIKQKYTVKYHNFITKIDTHIKGWEEDKKNKILILPRQSAYKLLDSGIIDNFIYKIPIVNNINLNYIGTPTSNQKIVCEYLMDNIYNKKGKKSCILKMLAGCHIIDTPIMMFNGKNKMVQNIKIGDKIMGDDSTPRNVLRLYHGNDIMYKITNDIDESYIVNGNHILCLINNSNNIIEITVLHYLKLPIHIRNTLKEYKKPIDFSTKKVPIDPYLIGLSLNKKFIPDVYKYNCKENRKKLLLGICTQYGSLNKYNIYEIQNDNILSNDIIYLSRSLGHICYKKKDIIYISKNVYNITSYNITIEKLSNDKFYGFQLDKNNRYLMGNFTCTHNSGKSFLGFELIKKINKKTLIIVPNTYLLEQWYKLLIELFPENKIGQYYTKKKTNGDIIVAIINSASNSNEFTFRIKRGLYKNISSEEFFKQFGLIIYDECHMYCTNSFKKIFNKANIENILGLSATPDERVNGFDKLIKFHLGDIIDANEIEEYEHNIDKFSSIINVVRYNAPDDFSNIHINQLTKLINVPKIIEEIISDPYRNQLIINNIINYYNQKRNIFIFSDRRGHLELLYNKFIYQMKKIDSNIDNYTYIPEVNIEDDKKLEKMKSTILYGGCKEDEIKTAREHSKIIFTTYQYSSTGVSIVKMDTLILATPRRNNMIQIIGRIFRLGSNLDTPRIIMDILDNKSVLKGQFSERKKAYNHRDSIFEENIIDYEKITI